MHDMHTSRICRYGMGRNAGRNTGRSANNGHERVVVSVAGRNEMVKSTMRLVKEEQEIQNVRWSTGKMQEVVARERPRNHALRVGRQIMLGSHREGACVLLIVSRAPEAAKCAYIDLITVPRQSPCPHLRACSHPHVVAEQANRPPVLGPRHHPSPCSASTHSQSSFLARRLLDPALSHALAQRLYSTPSLALRLR